MTEPQIPSYHPSVTAMLPHVAPGRRAAVEALFVLDARLRRILATTTEPLLGQMRLTWWHDAIVRLDEAPPPAEPLLRLLADQVLPLGTSGTAIAALVEAWEEMLDPSTEDHAIRGRTLFDLAARVMDVSAPGAAAAGAAWATGEQALHGADAAMQERAAAMLDRACDAAWPREARALLLPALALTAGRGAASALRSASFLLLGTRPLPRRRSSG